MKVAVHLHLYYLEQLPELLARLENLNRAGITWDLFVTMPAAVCSFSATGKNAAHLSAEIISPAAETDARTDSFAAADAQIAPLSLPPSSGVRKTAAMMSARLSTFSTVSASTNTTIFSRFIPNAVNTASIAVLTAYAFIRRRGARYCWMLCWKRPKSSEGILHCWKMKRISEWLATAFA